MNLLAIETSTEYCSLAVGAGDRVFARHQLAGQRHAETILAGVHELVGQAGVALTQIEGIAYGAGPGSFTGLRVACGVTQGLAMALGIRVVGIGSLLALAEQAGAAHAICCVDARMSEVYHAVYRRGSDGTWVELCAPRVCRPEDAPPPPGARNGILWTACGSGFISYREVLEHRYAGLLEGIAADALPTATAVLRLARPRFAAGEATAAESALPVYIRDRVALKTSERI